jgi:hypothetical protein
VVREVLIALAVAGLSACGGKPKDVTTADLPSEREIKAIANDMTAETSAKKDAPLYALLCQRALATSCPADIDDKLKPFYSQTEGTRLALADAFVNLKASELAGSETVADDVYLRAAYLVALGREPDAEGSKAHLDYIARTGDRTTVLRAMMQSPEFKGG